MPTILITGASSGIGLAFLHAHATSTTTNTIITCDIIPLPSSSSLPPNNKITHHILDITSSSSIKAFTSSIHQTPIDLIIHSIGIRGLVKSLHTSEPGSAKTAETLDAMDLETLTSTFAVNAAGAFMLFRELVPNLVLAATTKSSDSLQQKQQQPKVVVMTSRMGSIAANHGGGGYAYRASKAALNAMVKSLSIDVPSVTWVLCHPGRVESNLVRYKEEGAITADESVSGLLPLIESWGKEDSGRFYDRFGEKIEW